ncbi:MAG: transglycosylase domain-containing protein [Gammaproteobacteria bacterium]
MGPAVAHDEPEQVTETTPAHPHLSLVTEEKPQPPQGDTPEPAEAPPRKRRIKPALVLLLLMLLVLLAGWGYYESRTSAMQARFFAGIAQKVSYRVEKGASNAIRFPKESPYDERLGYSSMPDYLKRLASRDYVIESQARMSPKMVELADMGLFATYREKTRAGLDIYDAHAQPLFSARYPERVYDKFDDAPALLVKSLLFIENRELLDPTYPKRNPAVEWDRFSKAVFDKSLHIFSGSDRRSAGGSTLATQIEKYRHSPEGRTGSLSEKLRQMVSATLRSYQYGEDTTNVRRKIVVDYLNTVPLSAKLGYGEVNGIGDGMWVWYGRDFASVNRELKGPITTPEAALAYKQALSLMIAQRRPAHYLGAGAQDLEELSNVHLRVLAQAGVITPQLRDLALGVKLHPSTATGVLPPEPNSFVSRKAANAVRAYLGNMLGESRLYNLDRLDLSVVTTLDARVQEAVTAKLRSLRDGEQAAAAGLTGKGMLGNGDPANVVYSFTLLERGDKVNYLRVQTDNYDQPLDINDGAKLDLGSTAKLRSLITYLDIINQLHKRYASKSAQELAGVTVDPKDALSRWALDYLIANPNPEQRGLTEMLNAAMERKYSGNPGEGFFTNGGILTFGNFSKLDNTRILTVREGLRNSTNLLFVRMMRDIVRYYMFQLPGSSAALLADADDPRRSEYLSRFADREGTEFLNKFWAKYKGKDAAAAEAVLLDGRRKNPTRLAAIHRTIAPTANLQQFRAFLDANLDSSNEVEEEKSAKMFETFAPDVMSLADRGYLAGVHPLELWLVGYLRTHPKTTYDQMIAASVKERQEVYSWLFKTHRKHAQDKRIAGLLEVEAFLKIHAQWKKMGYPFDSLVPSYATVLGASADRPSALAEMMGIVVNGGLRKPIERVDSLHFARGTPYETLVRDGKHTVAEQVLAPEVARVTANEIRGVVSDGTAKRVKTAFQMADGSVVAVGGKTGTGDQRFEVYARGGGVISSRYVNRSATFVFNIGERFFGSMTAYVHGPESGKYDFTSALPVQLLATLAPTIMPMVEPNHEQKKAAAAAAAAVSKSAAPTPVAGGAVAVAEGVHASPGSDTKADSAKPAAAKPAAAKLADAKPAAAKQGEAKAAPAKAAAKPKPPAPKPAPASDLF